jgi:Cu2+-exporting ATPase
MSEANINTADAAGLARGGFAPSVSPNSRDTDAPARSQIKASTLDVYDMDCAACAILIETELRKLPGVVSASVHYATQRARIRFDGTAIDETALIERIMSLGHTVHTTSHSVDRARIVRQIRRRFQWQTGLATFCAMQIMMFSLPRFLGGDDLDAALAKLMDGASLALVLPVLLFCAGTFFRGAIREWKIQRIGMDSAIAVSVVSAFAGSLWHVWVGSGQLYFDSIAMFIALLLGVRWFEWEGRESNRASLERLVSQATPPRYGLIDKASGGISRFIDISAIEYDCLVLVGHLQSVPTDGWLQSNSATLDESVLTGESVPVSRTHGAHISAGSINLSDPFVYRTQGTAQTSTTQRLLDLADLSERPSHRAEYDLMLRWFVPVLFAVATITLLSFLNQGTDVALERAIAVLIVSCPCALALAAPSAYARAFTQLASLGTIVRRSEALHRLAAANAFVFDKTGTLTDPYGFRLNHLRLGVTESQAKSLIASLEAYANHPLATSIRNAFAGVPLLAVNGAQWKTGQGVEGDSDEVHYRLGRWEYVREFIEGTRESAAGANESAIYLVDHDGLVCTIEFDETLRIGARELIETLRPRYRVEIMSGDRPDRVTRIGHLLDIPSAEGGLEAHDKQKRIVELQRGGSTVAMVGDGWNDSVAFAQADVSIAASGAIDVALRSADLVCTSNSLQVLAKTIDYAKQLRRIIRENYAWAIGYNLIAIPIAALGFIDPILAAIGMAASSAIVVFNTMRLRNQ